MIFHKPGLQEHLEVSKSRNFLAALWCRMMCEVTWTDRISSLEVAKRIDVDSIDDWIKR